MTLLLVAALETACLAAGSTCTPRDLRVAAAQSQSPAPATAAPGEIPAAQRFTIRGTVMEATTGAPVRSAQVQLTRITGGLAQGVRTDTVGRFELSGLPSGRYRLTATKLGFTTPTTSVIGGGPSQTTIEVGQGELKPITLQLYKAGVIVGRVVDEFGDPVVGARIQAQGLFTAQDEALLAAALTEPATSDDLGQFRLFGLKAGNYFVSATPRTPAAIERPEEGVATFDPTSTRSREVKTYFPGTPSLFDARTVRVELGQAPPEVVIPVRSIAIGSIKGVVRNADGAAAHRQNLTLRQRVTMADGVIANLTVAATASLQDGSYTFTNVPPGDYEVSSAGPGQPGEYALVPVTVAGGEPTFLEILTAPPSTVRGRIVVDAASRGDVPTPADVIMYFVPSAAGRMLGRPAAKVNDDLTFEASGLVGPQLIRGAAGKWVIKSVTVDGANVTDEVVDFRTGQRWENVQVVVTSRVSELNGSITGATAAVPATDFVVYAFSQDPAQWTFANRRYAMARVGADGTFTIRGLPEGRYFAALASVGTSGVQNAELLKTLRPGATAFELQEGSTRTLALTVPGTR